MNQEQNKEPEKITIKRGKMVFTCNRDELVEVDQSPDGMMFSFKWGIVVHYTDQYMTLEIKERIKQAINLLTGGNVLVDLNNYNKPVMVTHF